VLLVGFLNLFFIYLFVILGNPGYPEFVLNGGTTQNWIIQ